MTDEAANAITLSQADAELLVSVLRDWFGEGFVSPGTWRFERASVLLRLFEVVAGTQAD